MIAKTERAMNIPEDQIISRCRAGDEDAFGVLYRQYERLVFRSAYHLLGSREDAFDIQQETFIKAYHAIRNFRGECSLATWLLKITVNLCRTHLRVHQRRTNLLTKWEEETVGDDPFHTVAQAQTTEIVQAALLSLPLAQRELIVLREYEELSYEEIGNVLKCATVTVRVKLYRARCRLKERIEALLKENS